MFAKRRLSSPSITRNSSIFGGNSMAKTTIAPYGAEEHSAAVAHGKQTKSAPTAVVRASYDAESGNLVLDLKNGAHVALPVSHIGELKGHSPEELAQVEVSPARDGLLWRSIEVGISAPGLLTDFFGSAVRAQLGTIGGRRLITTAKARAARKNGAKGGRPRVAPKAL